ncbi:MAG: right-handed parallel beta-helix repeat-containing protein [Myxococcales bacterium]|nr:right-handed parallel beta-helix repeat-containing protein [Myxococcales bacterium]
MPGEPNYFPMPRTAGSVSAITLTPGKTDYASELQFAIDNMITGTVGRVELAPSPTPYPLSKTIVIPANESGFVAFNGNGATLRATKPMESLIRFGGQKSMSTYTFENVHLDAANRAAYGFIGIRLNQRTGLIRGVSVSGARRSGFWLRACQAGVFASCSSTNNRQYGFLIEGGFVARFLQCTSDGNGLDGFRIASLKSTPEDTEPFFSEAGAEQWGQGPELLDCVSSNNERDGISIGRPPLEGFATPGTALFNTTLSNASIAGNTRHGLRLLGDAYGVLITNSTITPGPKTVAWASAAYVDPREDTNRFIRARLPRGDKPVLEYQSPVLTFVETRVKPWPNAPRWTLTGDATTPDLKVNLFGASDGWVVA